jgi:hypothetical protein
MELARIKRSFMEKLMKMKKKMVVKLESTPKPRNPLHAVLASKRGGPHEKPHKSLRALQKSQDRRHPKADSDVGLFHGPACFEKLEQLLIL